MRRWFQHIFNIVLVCPIWCLIKLNTSSNPFVYLLQFSQDMTDPSLHEFKVNECLPSLLPQTRLAAVTPLFVVTVNSWDPGCWSAASSAAFQTHWLLTIWMDMHVISVLQVYRYWCKGDPKNWPNRDLGLCLLMCTTITTPMLSGMLARYAHVSQSVACWQDVYDKSLHP